MWFLIFNLMFWLPEMIESARDPIQDNLPPGAERRDLVCELLSTEAAMQKAPGQIPESRGRTDRFDRRAMICREKLFHEGARRPQDDAILERLQQSAAEIAARIPEPEDGTPPVLWHVETHYPDAQVAYKIGFALKNTLLERGLRVSDRMPDLAAGDVEVLASQPAHVAYRLACQRYAANGSMGPDDAVLAVVLRHPQETALHAGVCQNGRWRWLQ